MEERKLRLITAGLAAFSVIFLILSIVFIALYASKTCSSDKTSCSQRDQQVYGYLIEKHNAGPKDSSALKDRLAKEYGNVLYFGAGQATADLTVIVVLAKSVKPTDMENFLNGKKASASRSFLLDATDGGFKVYDGNNTNMPVCATIAQTTPTSATTPNTGTTKPGTPATKPNGQVTGTPATKPGGQVTGTPATKPGGHVTGTPATKPGGHGTGNQTTKHDGCPTITCPTTPHPPKQDSACHDVAADIVFVVDVVEPYGDDTRDNKVSAIKDQITKFADGLTMGDYDSRVSIVTVDEKQVVYNPEVYFTNNTQELEDELENAVVLVPQDNGTIAMNEALTHLANAKSYRPTVNTIVIVIADHTELDVKSTRNFQNTDGSYSNFLFAAILPVPYAGFRYPIDAQIPTSPAFYMGNDVDHPTSYKNLDIQNFLKRVVCNHAPNKGAPPVISPPATIPTSAPTTKHAGTAPNHATTAAPTALPPTTTIKYEDTLCESLNIIFIVDRSLSIPTQVCEQAVIPFMKDFVARFTVAKTKTTLAAITFNDDAQVVVDINDPAASDPLAFISKFVLQYQCEPTYLLGKTNLIKPFDKAISMLTGVQTKKTVVITITDGVPNEGSNTTLFQTATTLRGMSTLFFVGAKGVNGFGFPNPTDLQMMDGLAGDPARVYDNTFDALNGQVNKTQISLNEEIAQQYPCPVITPAPPVKENYCKQTYFVAECTEMTEESRADIVDEFNKIAKNFNDIDNSTQFSFICYDSEIHYYQKYANYPEFSKNLEKLKKLSVWDQYPGRLTDLRIVLEQITVDVAKQYHLQPTFAPTFVFASQTSKNVGPGPNNNYDIKGVAEAAIALKTAVYQSADKFYGLDLTQGYDYAPLHAAYWDTLFMPGNVVKYSKNDPHYDLSKTNIYKNFENLTCVLPTIEPCTESIFDLIIAVQDRDASVTAANETILIDQVLDVLRGFTDSKRHQVAVVSYGVNPPTVLYQLDKADMQKLNETLYNHFENVNGNSASTNDAAGALNFIEKNIQNSRPFASRVILFVSEDFAAIQNGTKECADLDKEIESRHLAGGLTCREAPFVYALSLTSAEFCDGGEYMNKQTFHCPLANTPEAQKVSNSNSIIQTICMTQDPVCTPDCDCPQPPTCTKTSLAELLYDNY
uniref:VWFA domain-containing protein n=1 Tax=Steinernema glaseri TaxID=37863 RepID=A0A1I8A8D9_9BILA